MVWNPLRILRNSLVLFLLLAITACGEQVVLERGELPSEKRGLERISTGNGVGSVFGEGGIFGSSSNNTSGGGIGVNAYLWRATLDTISFMPITSADPFGGVIITDWHASNESPDERFKMNIYILGQQLRADGVRVAVFRQVLQNQVWRDAELPQGTSTKIEDAVLMRARQMRNQTLGAE